MGAGSHGRLKRLKVRGPVFILDDGLTIKDCRLAAELRSGTLATVERAGRASLRLPVHLGADAGQEQDEDRCSRRGPRCQASGD
jgi:hypothetical protein